MKEITAEIRNNLIRRLGVRGLIESDLRRLEDEFPDDCRGLIVEQVQQKRKIEEFVLETVKKGPSLFHYLVWLCRTSHEVNLDDIYTPKKERKIWLEEFTVGSRKIRRQLGKLQIDLAHSGRVLAYLREKCGYTQTQLAGYGAFPGKDDRQIRKWESEGVPKLKIPSAAKFFNLSDRYFKDPPEKEELDWLFEQAQEDEAISSAHED